MKKLFENNNLNYEKISNMVADGALIIYPTDTVYGLGASVEVKKSLDKIYEVKERREKSPLIALLSDKKYVDKIAVIDELNREKIEKLIENFWPGGLTIILDKKRIIPPNMVSNGSSVGVRIPNHKISIKIIESCGGILATTSANISGEPSPKSYDELSEKIKSRVEIVVDDNETLKGVESTIIDMRSTPKILREGHITRIKIEKIIGKVK
ncbi:L-threonylcarbamoyladenylate synthase [Psychrilyobacter sp.]|uniref:L-threonylcarbamoyladenylate synthase n=1 Tax=Psychrilyobacter sp. TaxID=2586924 RepID=UPI00301957BF